MLGITAWSQIDKNYIPHVRIIVIIFISLCNRHMRGLGKLGKKKGSEEGEGVVSYRIWTCHVIPRDRLYKRTWRGTRVVDV